MRRTLACLACTFLVGRAAAQERIVDPPETLAAREAFVDRGVVWSAERLGADANGEHLRIAVGGRAFEAWVADRVLVRAHDGGEITEDALRARDLVLVSSLAPSIGLVVARSTRSGEDALSVAARTSGDPALHVVPDLLLLRGTRAIDIPPDDTRYSGQWYLHRIDIEDAWPLSTGDASTTIAIVDTGCDLTHPDLPLLPGYDAFDDDDDPSPPAGTAGNAHGTACAGVAAAIGDNGMGIAGTCPECTVRCVRLLPGNDTPIAYSADVAAFQHAIDWNVAVVSNSWGFRESVPVPSPLRDIMLATMTTGRGGLGAVIVFAAGNESRLLDPGELYDVPGVITVGAINNFDEAASFSNFGEAVDLVAPTGSLTTDITGPDGDDPGDYTSLFGGTSSACPVVAGVVGLLASARPDATAMELHDAVIHTTRPARFATPDERGHDPLYGYGIVDPGAALRSVLPEIDGGVPDAGASDAGLVPTPSGCACSAARREDRSAFFVVLVLGLALARRRR